MTPSVQLRFDLRVPPFARTDYGAQYQACLEMVSWADRLGFDGVSVSEHHGDPAGFTSAPLTLAAAILGRTDRIPVTVSALLAPLHDPVRVAEQLATIDCLAPGRLRVIVGAGYRRAEFEMAGVDRATRGRRVAELVEVCRAAWTGEPFDWQGRTVLVTPTPATPGGPMILVGGKTEVAARRAARLRCPFAPASADEALVAAYRAECERTGYEGTAIGVGGPSRPGFVMVSEEPEETWQAVLPHIDYDAETYASWQDDAVRSDWVVPDRSSEEGTRTAGRYVVVSPEECVELIRRDGGITLHPLMGGIAPDMAWSSLQLFEARVLPSV